MTLMLNFAILFFSILLVDARTNRKHPERHSRQLSHDNPYGKVWRSIFADYQPSVRPVLDVNTVTNVELALRLYNVIDVDEAQESVEMLQWLHMSWRDEQLLWNPQEFGNVSVITVPYRQLWVPDISYQELVQGLMYPLDDANTYAHLHSNGNVSVVVSVVVRVFCRLNVAEFPFDTQSCNFTIAPWFHDASQVTVSVNEERFNGTHVGSNSEFTVHSVRGSAILAEYDDGPPFGETKWTIVFERKPMYYIVTLFMPTYVITAICIVGLFSPSNANMEREEKCSMGATALLTMAVILLMVAELMPKSATQFPRLGRFIIVEMAMTCLGTVGAVLIMYLNCQAALGVKVPRLLLVLVGLHTFNHRCMQSYWSCPQEESFKSPPPLSLPSSVRSTYLSLPTRQALLMLHDVKMRIQKLQDRVHEYESQRRLADLWGRVCYRLDLGAMVLFNLINSFWLIKFVLL